MHRKYSGRIAAMLLCLALLAPDRALASGVSEDVAVVVDATAAPTGTPEPTVSPETPTAEPAAGETPPDPVPTEPADEPTEAEDFAASLRAAGFPESYIAPLCTLHESYPSWRFRPFTPGADWSSAVAEETVLGRSLVWGSAVSSWKSTQDGAYNWTTSTWNELDSGGWVAASGEIVAYYMDPRNSLDSSSVFQFLDQCFDAETQTMEGMASVTAGTFLGREDYDADQDASNGVDTLTETLFQAGQTCGVNPYVLAAMMIQEMGAAGNSQSITGTNPRFPGVYNAFNIGAYKTPGFSAVERGLWYAAGGSNGAGTSYGRPWTTLARAIAGGAEFYALNYVNAGQTTLYLKRFNVQGANMYRNQYMTNVAGAKSEGQLLSRAYSESMRALPLVFSIPVYTGMPSQPSPLPGGDGSPNAKLGSLTVSAGTMAPEFHRDVTEYTVIVSPETGSLQLDARAAYSGARVSGGGEIALAPGDNVVAVTVTAENGAAAVYTVHIVRPDGSEPLPTDEPVVVEPVTAPTPSPSPTPTPAPAIRIGDVNGDGKVMINDLIRLRNHLIGTAPLTGNALRSADADRNGTVQINDLIRIRNYLLGAGTLPE